MADTTFVSKVTKIATAWLQDVNDLAYRWTQSGTGAVARAVADKARERVSVLDFIPVALHGDIRSGASVVDLTAYVQAAIDYAHDSNIGEVFFPAGLYRVTSVVKTFNVSGLGTWRTVNIVGAGTKSTRIFKFDGSATPLFDFTTQAAGLEAYSGFRDLTLDAGTTGDGVKLTDFAYFHLVRVDIQNYIKGFHGLGALIGSIERCWVRYGETGLYLRANPGATILANQIVLSDSVISNNTVWGIDFDNGDDLNVGQCDLEANGTAGNANTGAISVGGNAGGAGHYCPINIDGCWFESNKGVTLKVAANAVAILNLQGSKFIDDENALQSGALINNLKGVDAGSETVVLSGTYSNVIGCAIHTLTDSSTYKVHLGTPTNAISPDSLISPLKTDVMDTGSLPADSAAQNGRVVIENDGAGERGLVFYAAAKKYRLRTGVHQRLTDHFLGDSLDARWNGRVGTDPQCVVPTILAGQARGIVRLLAGDDAAGTMAVNGCQMDSGLNWLVSDGGLTLEVRFTLPSVDTVAVFFGFTDQVAALEMPFTLAAGDALTANAADAVGVLFDTAADTDTWWLVGVANTTPATKQNSAVSPANGVEETWRVEVSTTGVANFFRNGAAIGSAMAGAVRSTIQLTPVVALFSRAANARSIDLDYIDVEVPGT